MPEPFSTLRLDRARRRRGHSTYRSTYREAEGSVTIGANSIDAYGAMGKLSWSEHSNG